MVEFWNSLLTEKSWEILQEIRKKYIFILIGGWAAYLIAGRQKSKDIDIVVSINELQKLKSENLIKNDRLKKYEIKRGDVDIDIYLEHFSKLTIPSEDIKNYSVEIQGFKVVCPEALLILKQGAHNDRKNSVKGEKDLLDIISILFFSEIDFTKYAQILRKYGLQKYQPELRSLIKNFKDYDKLNLIPAEFKRIKNKIIEKL